jgi:hypothetical protein
VESERRCAPETEQLIAGMSSGRSDTAALWDSVSSAMERADSSVGRRVSGISGWRYRTVLAVKKDLRGAELGRFEHQMRQMNRRTIAALQQHRVDEARRRSSISA